MTTTANQTRQSKYLSYPLGYIEPIVQQLRPSFWLKHQMFIVTSVRSEKYNMTTYRLKPCKRFKKVQFTPGQHVCLAIEIDGRRLERTFSISSSDKVLEKEGYLELSISTQAHGKVTPWLKENICIGNKVHIKNIGGSFVFHPQAGKQLFLAAGSGITPILSMLESVDDEQLLELTLLFYIRDAANTPFMERLGRLYDKGLNLSVIDSSTDGRLSSDHLARTHFQNFKASYICGPAGFITTAKELLRSQIRVENIHYEFFGTGTPPSANNTSYTLGVTNAAGKNTQIQSAGNTLLNELERADLKPLYGCRAGICHQCTAQKLSGRVQNILTNELSENGPEEIQLCMCKAVSDTSLLINERDI